MLMSQEYRNSLETSGVARLSLRARDMSEFCGGIGSEMLLLPVSRKSFREEATGSAKRRKTVKTFAHLALLALLSGIFCLPAGASNFSGSTISWQYYAWGGVYNGRESNGTFVDNGGVGGTFIDQIGLTYFNIVAGSNYVEFDYSVCTFCNRPFTWGGTTLSKPPDLHNGVDLLFSGGPKISSVSIDPVTNMAGFDLSHVYFSGSEIEVDWHQLAYDKNTIVKLDLNSGAPTPEPGTLVMLGTGALGLFAARRRRVRSA